MLSKTTLRHVENSLAVAPHFGVNPTTTDIPSLEWVCRQFSVLAARNDDYAVEYRQMIDHWATVEFEKPGAREEHQASSLNHALEHERKARLWRKWSAEVREHGVPADLLTKYGWRG
jgi:hypothetical protein